MEENTEEYYEEFFEDKIGYEDFVIPKLIELDEIIDDEKFNMLLFHSPQNILKDPDNIYDLILTGHIHQKSIFRLKSFSSGLHELSNLTTGIVAFPVTDNSDKKMLLRKLYKPCIQTIDIKKI